MSFSSGITNEELFSEAQSCIKDGKLFVYSLKSPTPENKDVLKTIVLEYLKCIQLEKSYNLLCLCLEEIISNSVKANIKRAFFISNNLNINNKDDYEKGMKTFKEKGLSKIKDPFFVNKINTMGLYVKLYFTGTDSDTEKLYLFVQDGFSYFTEDTTAAEVIDDRT